MLNNPDSPTPEHPLKVTELTQQIKAHLEGDFAQVWVKGEVSNLRRQSSGHLYFSIKDAGSQLPCVLFARDAARLNFELKDSMEVTLFGGLSVYVPHGRYQLIAKMAVQSGLGRLQIELERLKRKLAEEGLFDKARKRTLPALPMRIAVVTSPTGAAIRDFLQILERRDYKGEIVIFPARVQGKGSTAEVTAMLEYAGASKDFDLVVITRGGGSIEDLWAFNKESLARAVAACPIPTISAIGHEIDTVLTDHAADYRAETPSAAAELISTLYLETIQRLKVATEELHDYAETSIAEHKQRLRHLEAKMHIIAPERQIELLGMKLDDFENRLSQSLKLRLAHEKNRLARHSQSLAEHHPRIKIALARQSLADNERRLGRAANVEAHNKHEHLTQIQKRLENSSLNATLHRGYAVIQTADRTIISSAQSARAEKSLTARFHDGEIELKQ